MFSSLEHSLQDDQLQLALKQAGKHSEVGEKNQTHRCRFVQATGATHFNYLTLYS